MPRFGFRISLLIVVLMSMFGFTLQTLAQDTVDIAVLLPDAVSSPRWENDDRRFLAAAFERAGVTYSIVNAEGDRQTQLAQAEQAIADGAKVLMLVNNDSNSGAAIIAMARKAGAAVIDYDRLTIEGPGADFYVSFDNEAVGRLQGEGLVAAVESAQATGTLGDKVNVAILNGSPTDNNATLLANGYHGVLDPLFGDRASGWTKVAERSVPDWDYQQALTIFEAMQTGNPDINAAIGANDGLGQAVITARQNAGLDYIPVTGQDASIGAIQNVLAGRQSLTIYKAIKAEAEAAAALAVALVQGDDATMMVTGSVNNGSNDILSVLLIPISVTKDNVAETVIADGFRTWAEICVDEFAQFCPADALLEPTPEATPEMTPESTPEASS